jgi:hypothetical protein
MANIKISELVVKDSPSTSATLVGVDNGETVQIPVSALGTSGGGIIDVTELPTENIDTSAIYRAKGNTIATMYYGRQDASQMYPIIVVDELPSVGVLPDLETQIMTLYFLTTDQTVYCYFDAASAETMDMPEGWSTFEDFIEVTSTIVSSIDEIPEDDTEGCYILIATGKPSLFTHYNNGSAVEQMKIVTKNDFGGIIYATEKPSTPQQAIYVITEDEVVKADMYDCGTLISPDGGYCEIVDELPENPNIFLDTTTYFSYTYYLTKDNQVWAYIDQFLSNSSGGAIPVGWLTVDTIGVVIYTSVDDMPAEGQGVLLTKQPKTRVYVPMQDGTFLELTSGIRTRFDENSGTVSITEM